MGVLHRLTLDSVSNKLSFIFRNSKSIAVDPSGFIPPGSILFYAGSSAPLGFLICDGSSLSISQYPALFSSISSTYNTQINPTTGLAYAAPAAGQFRLPDYRGVFLRGVGTPGGLDSVSLGGYQAQKTAKNGLTNSTSGVTGSVSTSGSTSNAGGHVHTITWYGNGGAVQGIGTAGGDQSGPLGGSGSTGVNSVPNHVHTLVKSNGVTPGLDSTFSSGSAAAQTVTGDNETRPLSRGVNYIIKF